MNKKVRGKKMFAMPSKKVKAERKESKQKHKAEFRSNW